MCSSAMDTNGLQFNDQAIFHEEVGEVFSQHGAILIVNREGMLRKNLQAEFPKTMHEGILIHLLKMAVAVIAVNGEAGPAQMSHSSLIFDHFMTFLPFLCLFVFFVAIHRIVTKSW